ncbi:MAG TPA: ABC transporter substrate-binding protein [Gemmatimonadales bacterium]|jgi:putative spermidine/putrescine transport system substrate-binding protein/spermidine/putrescine transport system substrate-binding protein|nr:ABC transporter substrate-binding protein [Gemmatimonadales bacterium]
MTWRRSRLPAVLALATWVVAGCGGGEKPASAPAGKTKKITIASTGDARADAKTYLAQLCPKPIGGELNFMVWEGYTDTLFARPFEDACGVKVNATYMGSSDDLVAKLRAGGAETIDLISPSSDAATAIIDAGLASPLDLSRIPSYTDLSEGFRHLKVARKDSTVFGVPWAFGPNPLIYDSTKVSKPDSWGMLWDKKYRGKLSLQDDIATLYMVAQYLGMDDPNDPSKLYNLSDEDLAKVKAKMLELRPNVRKYWVTAGDMTQLFQSGEVVAGEGWPLMTNQLRQAKFPAGETIPKEGTTAWADHWVLTKGAKNLDAAYAWLEYTAQPFTQKLLYDVTAYIVANPAAKSYMSPEQAASQRDIADYGTKVNFWQWSPRREKYQEIWNEVKAAK